MSFRKIAIMVLTTCLIGSAAAFPTNAAATAAVPGAPERELRALVDRINRDDPAEMRAYVLSRFTERALTEKPADRIARYFLNIYRWTGGIDLTDIYPQGATEIGAFAVARKSHRNVFLRIEVLADSQINRYEAHATPEPIDPSLPLPNAGASIPERLSLIRHGLADLAKRDQLSGVLLISRRGKIVFAKAYGEKSKSRHEPNTLSTLFGVASTGKAFTTVAVAQLAAAGKLDFDTPILHYLPDYPNRSAAGRITIRQLLTHTSGLGDFFDKPRPRKPIQSLEDYLPLFANDPLLYEPGKGNAYSNAGFLVLSLIVERLSGERFGPYLQSHILGPSGMTHTGFGQEGTATGYTRDGGDDPLAPNRPWVDTAKFYASLPSGPPNGAGGEVSTAGDLARFGNALLYGKLLPPAGIRAILDGKLGFEVGSLDGHQRYGHNGGGPGVNASLFLYPDDGLVMVALTNYDPPVGQIVADRVARIMLAP